MCMGFLKKYLRFPLVLIALFVLSFGVWNSSVYAQQQFLHPIGIQLGANGYEFYNKNTGAVFIPRGNSYTRLEMLKTPFSPNAPGIVHALFYPPYYDSVRIETALSQMQSDGYTVVRVFLEPALDGNPNGSGLLSSYMANVADFLTRAKNHNLFVILDLGFLPEVGGYYAGGTDPQLQNLNWHYMSSQALEDKKRYVTDVITTLQALHAPLDIIFAYNIMGEQTFLANVPPLSLTSGTVTTIAGTYDLSKTDKNTMMDDNLVIWIRETRAAILAVDPSALVTIQFVPPSVYTKVNNDSNSVSRPFVAYTTLNGNPIIDFVSLSLYPTWGIPISTLLSDVKIPANAHIPTIILEEGVAKDSQHQDVQAVATQLRDWQISSCPYHIQGWLHWTWDTTEQQNPMWWTAAESNGYIEKFLSPHTFTPCPTGSASPVQTPISTPYIYVPTPTILPFISPIPKQSNQKIPLQTLLFIAIALLILSFGTGVLFFILARQKQKQITSVEVEKINISQSVPVEKPPSV